MGRGLSWPLLWHFALRGCTDAGGGQACGLRRGCMRRCEYQGTLWRPSPFDFIQAPSVDVLRERLIKRQTDSMEEIEKRIAKAAWETEFAQGKFDRTIINDDLDTAKREILEVVQAFLEAE